MRFDDLVKGLFTGRAQGGRGKEWVWFAGGRVRVRVWCRGVGSSGELGDENLEEFDVRCFPDELV
jgi:hypothetical protein